ncbi:MAG: response regulator [Candidatus Cloacimonetes bacterium]|nr:response regulator [Candidatus Cloacimonadota bacterium]
MEISDDLIKQISFKLRNPLSGILYHLDSMKDSGLNSDQLSSLELAKDAFSQVLTSVSDLDDLIRLSKTHLEAQYQKIQLIDLLSSIKSVVVNGSGCEIFLTNINDNVPTFIVSDLSFVRQLLLYITNLAIHKSKALSLNVSCDQHPINQRFTVSFSITFPKSNIILPRNDYGIFGLNEAYIQQISSCLNATIKKSESEILLTIPDLPSLTDSDLYLDYSQLKTIVVSDDHHITHRLEELFACFEDIYFCKSQELMFQYLKKSYLEDCPTDLIIISENVIDSPQPALLQKALQKGDLYGTKIVCLCDVNKPITSMHTLNKDLYDQNLLKVLRSIFPQCTRASNEIEFQQKPRVLVIDDDRVNNSILTQAFLTRNCLVSSCFSGQDALVLLEQFSYDFVVLDYHLPNMTGQDISKFIRNCDLAMHQKTIIVGISADVNSDKIDSFKEDSTDLFIQKPVSAIVIQNIVERYFLDPNIRNIVYHPRILIFLDPEKPNENFSSSIKDLFPNATILESNKASDTCKFLGLFLPDLLITNQFINLDPANDILKIVKTEDSFRHVKTLTIEDSHTKSSNLTTETDTNRILQSPYKPTQLKQVILDLLGSCSQNLINPSPQDMIKKYNFPKELFNSTRLVINIEDEQSIQDVLEGFQNSIKLKLVNFRAALADRNLAQARDNLHSIKGGAATVGAIQLKAIARTLEILVSSNQVSRVDILEPLLKESFQKTVEIYSNINWSKEIQRLVRK